MHGHACPAPCGVEGQEAAGRPSPGVFGPDRPPFPAVLRPAQPAMAKITTGIVLFPCDSAANSRAIKNSVRFRYGCAQPRGAGVVHIRPAMGLPDTAVASAGPDTQREWPSG